MKIMNSKKYFTLFCSGYSWQNPVGVMDFIGWIIKEVVNSPGIKIRGVQKYSKSMRDELLSEKLIAKYQQMLTDNQLEELSIYAMSKFSHGFEFYIYFQNVRSVLTPEYAKKMDKTLPEVIEDSISAKIFSVSLIDDKNTNRAEIVERFEKCFCNLNACYGYIDKLDNPIVTPFAFSGSQDTGQAIRITDINFNSEIDGVHPYQILSAGHIQKIKQYKNEMAVIGRNLGTKYLLIKDGFDKNVFEVLKSLLPCRSKDVYEFVLSKRQVDSVGGLSELRNISIGALGDTYADGSVSIKEQSPSNYDESVNHTKGLQTIFNRCFPDINRKEKAQEFISEYRGVFHPAVIIRRYPQFYKRPGSMCEVIRANKVDVNYLRITILTTKVNERNRSVNYIEETIQSWFDQIKLNEELYGRADIIDALASQKIDNGGMHKIGRAHV
jgi:hypothetical protein